MSVAKPVALVLFVSDDSPRSLVATANIRAALGSGFGSAFALEVVNVFEDPDRALAARVLVTPSLLAPAVSRRLVGDLSDHTKLLYFLHGLQTAPGLEASSG